MYRIKYFLWLSAIVLSAALHVDAQDIEQPQSPPKYRMELIHVFENEPTEFVFVVGNAGFRSVDSLKKFLSGLPAGSTLEWAPGCKRMGNEPLLSSPLEMEEFKAFCLERNINFVLVPSG